MPYRSAWTLQSLGLRHFNVRPPKVHAHQLAATLPVLDKAFGRHGSGVMLFYHCFRGFPLEG